MSEKNVDKVEKLVKRPLFGNAPIDGKLELPSEDIRWSIIDRVIGEGSTGFELSKEEKIQLQMIYNLERYLHSEDGIDRSQLRDHQKTVFEDIYKFLTSPPLDETGNLIKRGFIELPTGSGKTAIFSTLVDVLTRAFSEDQKRLKTLVLVPKLDLVSQTVGRIDEEQLKGFAKFASNVKVSEYHGNNKSPEGDAVIMTYQSLPIAIERGDVDADTFDLVICDEAHRSLSSKRKSSLLSIACNKTIIGLTASPSFETRKVEDFFETNIHTLDLREAIELGMLSPVRCFAVCSDSKIETLKQGEFSEEELAALIDDEWRNQKAVEFAKAFIEQGQQGIISCVPGENVKHAKLIASRLGRENIVDPATGRTRPVRAMTVHGYLDNRDEIYKLFESGGIDVLTYVDQLTEG